VDLADLVDAAGVIENSLGRSCFAGVDVGNNTDVSYFFYWIFAFGYFSHGSIPCQPAAAGISDFKSQISDNN
jgi:hypothetical protein